MKKIILFILTSIFIKSQEIDFIDSIYVSKNEKFNKYFYHSDHLGSTSYVADSGGNITQYHAYIPFGENLVSEYNKAYYKSDYKFNSKELDSNTGFYYYGARYYNPKTSLWLGTDPLAEKYPNISPYAYCLQTPTNAIDPDGKDVILLTWATHSLDVGHTAIAVSSRFINSKGQPDNTYDFYELGPEQISIFNISSIRRDVNPIYNKEFNLTKNEILNNIMESKDGKSISGYDSRKPHGIIEYKTTKETDNLVKIFLENKADNYNIIDNNCTSYVTQALEIATGSKISAREKIMRTRIAITPNKLFKSFSKMNNINIIKGESSSKLKRGFFRGLISGLIKI